VSEQRPFFFLFFQLWASILGPTSTTARAQTDDVSFLPISTVNILSLLNIAKFEGTARPMYRFHEDELQLQLDLQSSKLVVDLDTEPELDELKLHQIITTRDWFHVLLISVEDPESKTSVQESNNKLIAAFLSPPGKVMFHVEKERPLEYVWRSSAVQLQPDIVMANSGGMSAHISSGVLALRASETIDERNGSITLDLRKRTVAVLGLGLGLEGKTRVVGFPGQTADDGTVPGITQDPLTPVMMRLKDLKCYRLPVEAAELIRYP
jgi:hypothetical protein